MSRRLKICVGIGFALYLAVNLFYLDKYPLLISDEIIYTEAGINLMTEGKPISRLNHVDRLGKIDLIQHGRGLPYLQVAVWLTAKTCLKMLVCSLIILDVIVCYVSHWWKVLLWGQVGIILVGEALWKRL